MQDSIYPVIMCGGAGTRLWPASRPSRPKQFIDLAGETSLFQQTALRVAPLAGEHGRLIIVGGVRHEANIRDQLAQIGLDACVLLEPAPRDSAPAMAAAAAWVARRDPDGVLAVIASDHHVPDAEAFRTAIYTAAGAAREGRIVTLGVAPTGPSSAYGYIRPTGEGPSAAHGLSPVAAFVEKPDRRTAAAYLTQGYLWNSGNFIVSARTLIDALTRDAPAVLAAAAAALPEGDPIRTGLDVLRLGDVFADAPAISIDYAVMEKTSVASVLAVDFAWSDLGAWDAVLATGQGTRGLHVLEDSAGCMIRAPEGVMVAALGVSNLAIVVEPDAVLVCDLSRSQDLKAIVDRVRAVSPVHLDTPRPTSAALAVAGDRFAEWLRLRALPVWSTLGLGGDGAFLEMLALDGRPVARPRRARVQTRQIYVYAQAGLMGWAGPWRAAVASGVAALRRDFRRPDGMLRTLVAADGAPLDETAMVYDQAFALLALATAKQAGLDDGTLEPWAFEIRQGLLAQALPQGGIPEGGDHPFQANAHMHLLEACMAWEAAGGDAGWAALADTIVDLALTRFIDAEGGFLREFFAEDWSPAPGADGRLVEPGHQFEWAWLLTLHDRARSRSQAAHAVTRLYAAGRAGVARSPSLAMDALDDDGAVRSSGSRLWPQTEWLKASLILAETAEGAARAALLEDAASALRGLQLYLTDDGVWRDKHVAGGRFVDEPAPASSLYHIMVAFLQLARTGADQRLDGLTDLGLR